MFEEFAIENVPSKPFRKKHKTEQLISLLFATVSSKALIPFVFSKAVDEYNRTMSHKYYDLVEWMADIIFEYNPRTSTLNNVENMHNTMRSSGEYTEEELTELNTLAEQIFYNDFYGRCLPDIQPMDSILALYLKKYNIINNY